MSESETNTMNPEDSAQSSSDGGECPAFDEGEARTMDLAVGGQALIEGVMMRSPQYLAMAVRTPDHRIVIRKKIFGSIIRKLPFLNIPVIRGGIHLIETMGLGIDALMFSADQALSEDRIEKILPGCGCFGTGFSQKICVCDKSDGSCIETCPFPVFGMKNIH